MEIETGFIYVCGNCGVWSETRFETCICGNTEIQMEEVEE